MNINNYFIPSEGPLVISPSGFQKFTNNLQSFSNTLTSIYTSIHNDKFAIDSAWESQKIYYANYDTGYVKKIQYDGTELANISLINPLSLSVIQFDKKMSTVITDPPQEDRGCWIIDIGTKKLIKTDNELNQLYSLSGLINPVCVLSDLDQGCFVADKTTKEIIKISAKALMIDSYVLPSAPREMALDANGILWVVASNERIYSLYLDNNEIKERFNFSPFNNEGFSSSSSEIEDHIGSIDVDRNSFAQYLYVCGGNSRLGWIAKYDINVNLIAIQKHLNIPFPYVLKVVQGYQSETFYILSDPAKWNEYEYGSSSSSSSSSSSIDSSSSSSSIDSSSSSSSSSIDSSSSTESSSSESSANEVYYCALSDEEAINGTYERAGYHNNRPYFYNVVRGMYMYYLYFSDWGYYYGISPVLDDDEYPVRATEEEAEARSPEGSWYDFNTTNTFAVSVGPCSSSSSSSSNSSSSSSLDSSSSSSSSSSSKSSNSSSSNSSSSSSSLSSSSNSSSSSSSSIDSSSSSSSSSSSKSSNSSSSNSSSSSSSSIDSSSSSSSESSAQEEYYCASPGLGISGTYRRSGYHNGKPYFYNTSASQYIYYFYDNVYEYDYLWVMAPIINDDISMLSGFKLVYDTPSPDGDWHDLPDELNSFTVTIGVC